MNLDLNGRNIRDLFNVVTLEHINIHELVAKHLENKNPKSHLGARECVENDDALKYYDIAVGVTSVGGVIVGHSSPANINDYNNEMANTLSLRDLENKLFAQRAFLFKDNVAENKIEHSVFKENTGIVCNSDVGESFELKQYAIPLNDYIDLGEKTALVVLGVLICRNGFVVVDWAQGYTTETRKYEFCDLARTALTRANDQLTKYREFAYRYQK